MGKENQNKILNVPTLRFKEFKDEWNAATLGEITTNIEYGLNLPSKEFDGKKVYIRITDIDEVTRELIHEGFTSPNGDIKPSYLVEHNDILLARTGASTGKSFIYDNYKYEAYFAGFLIRFRPIEEVNARYVYYYLNTPNFKKFIKMMSARSGQPGVNSEEYKAFQIKLPSGSEQKKIATLLLKIDRRISVQRKLIKDYNVLKKAISNTIFTSLQSKGKKQRLVDLILKGRAGGTPTTSVKEYYEGEIPFLSINDMTSQRKYIFYTEKKISQLGIKNSSTWLVPVNSIILSMYASYGVTSINSIPLCISQAMIALILKPEVDLDFFYYQMVEFKENGTFHRLVGTGTQSNLSSDIVKNIMINMPSKKEQVKIGQELSKIDRLLHNAELTFNKLCLVKSILLKHLFI